MSDLYSDLGVPKDADEAALKKARNAAARRHHPDSGAEPSVEKFDKAQRAFLVLSDPLKRDEYDKTGKTEFKDPETEEAAEAMNIVAQAFSAVLGSGADPLTTNVVSEMRKLLRQALGSIAEKISQSKVGLKRLETFKARLKRKGTEGPDVLSDLVEGQIRGGHHAIAQYERAKRVHDRALTLVDDYEYEADPATRVNPYAGLDALLGQRRTGFSAFDGL